MPGVYNNDQNSSGGGQHQQQEQISGNYSYEITVLQLFTDTYRNGPSIVPLCASRKYRHCRGNRHYSPFCHYLLLPSVPSGFTGTIVGNKHYSTGTLEGTLLLYKYPLEDFRSPSVPHAIIRPKHPTVLCHHTYVHPLHARRVSYLYSTITTTPGHDDVSTQRKKHYKQTNNFRTTSTYTHTIINN